MAKSIILNTISIILDGPTLLCINICTFYKSFTTLIYYFNMVVKVLCDKRGDSYKISTMTLKSLYEKDETRVNEKST